MMHNVNSSYIAAIGYDPATRELRVRHTSGTTDVFEAVEQEVFDHLLLSDSKGSYVRGILRGRYACRREA